MSVRSSNRAPRVQGAVVDGNLAIFAGTAGTLVDGGPPAGGGGSVTNTGTLTADQLVIGNGGVDVEVLGSVGTTTTVLHGNGAGAPSFAAVSLTADVSGDLPLANLAQASAANRLLGRGSAAGAGDYQEITLGTGLTMAGTALSAGGGAAIGTGAVGSEPGSPATGDLYLPTNGFSAERYSGSAWVPWGPLYPFTAPISGDFAWVNQGSASLDTTNGGIYLLGTAAAGPSVRLRVKTAPGTPYTVTGILTPMLTSASFSGCGLAWRQSSDGKLVLLAYDGDVNTLSLSKWNTETSFSAVYTITAAYRLTLAPLFFRLADDGANRICSLSHDGQHWVAVHTVARTDFLTADQVGFFVKDQNATYAPAMTLLSWAQA